MLCLSRWINAHWQLSLIIRSVQNNFALQVSNGKYKLLSDKMKKMFSVLPFKLQHDLCFNHQISLLVVWHTPVDLISLDLIVSHYETHDGSNKKKKNSDFQPAAVPNV